jgi:hypothetical protein
MKKLKKVIFAIKVFCIVKKNLLKDVFFYSYYTLFYGMKKTRFTWRARVRIFRHYKNVGLGPQLRPKKYLYDTFQPRSEKRTKNELW